MPIVSVVMPAYNCEKYIQQAISSVMAQTLTDWELIIVNDCSRDRTLEIVEEIAGKEPRIRLFNNQKNVGAAVTRNTAFSHCRGEYVALLDSDDLWAPEKLERQVACARRNNAKLVYCSYAMIDENGEKKCPDFIVPTETDFGTMLVRSTISSSTALLHRSLTEKHQFPVNMYHEDLAYWLELLQEEKKAWGLQEVLASYRVAPGSRASNKINCAVNRWKIYRNFLGISWVKSVVLLVRYTWLGVMKYQNVRPARNR